MFFRRPPRRNPAPEPPHDPHSSAERITDPAQIGRFLQRLKDGHCLLNATVPGTPGSFATAVLRVYPDRDLLILDELNPRAGHLALEAQGRLNIRCRLHGVEYRFASVLQRIDEQRGIAFYHMQLPELVLHIQRRNHYRVPVDSTAGIDLVLPLQGLDADSSGATLLDLSVSGLGLQVETPQPPERGEILPACNLYMPDGTSIRSEIEIRFVQTRNQPGTTRLGGQFLKLERKSRNQLATLVRELERRHLRKQAR